MKVKDLRLKTLPELFKLLNEERKKLFDLKLQKSINKLKQTHLLKLTRKNIARILTIINEKKKNG
ncbi:MAG: 50S ribosomal protein L29 [Candidatus Parcubacteria bacterium]|nr:MAG: 50S ribosomal protein L29 [Candidatus Parcubacteria bacterium]